MRSFVLIGLLGVPLASTSIAQAHSTRSAWTASKAEKMVAHDATVPLAFGERASLLPELNRTVRLYGALRLRRAAGERQGPASGHVPGCPGPVRPRAQPGTKRYRDRRRRLQGLRRCDAGEALQALPLRRDFRGARDPSDRDRSTATRSCRR